jgi:hypothetical protein
MWYVVLWLVFVVVLMGMTTVGAMIGYVGGWYRSAACHVCWNMIMLKIATDTADLSPEERLGALVTMLDEPFPPNPTNKDALRMILGRRWTPPDYVLANASRISTDFENSMRRDFKRAVDDDRTPRQVQGRL